MTTEQKKLEELLLSFIEQETKAVSEGGSDIPKAALALMELWKFTFDLKDVSTKDLVAELERREGVEKRWLEPGKETIPQVSSPTILLIVTD